MDEPAAHRPDETVPKKSRRTVRAIVNPAVPRSVRLIVTFTSFRSSANEKLLSATRVAHRKDVSFKPFNVEKF